MCTKLPHTNGGRIPIPGHTDIDKIPVGQVGAGCNGGHAAVDRVESMGLSKEIGRCLGRASNPGHLDHPVGGDGELKACLDDGIGDGIMAAPCTECGIGPFVIPPGMAEIIFRQIGMTENGAVWTHLSPP